MKKKLKKDILDVLYSSALRCENMHHRKGDYHGPLDPCPREIKLKNLIQEVANEKET